MKKALPFQLKVCGMRSLDNILALSELPIQYMGFIFYEKSKRYITKIPCELPETIQKVGVFVDAPLSEITTKVLDFDLQVVQLHGQESVMFCKELRLRFPEITVWKVKGIMKGDLDFNQQSLSDYEPYVDAFLFDTKGKEKGGNGYCFDWTALSDYKLDTPFVLSGGIGLEQTEDLLQFLKTPVAQKLIAIDVNSKFEIQPAYKDVVLIQAFIDSLL